MNLTLLFNISFRSIAKHKARSLLTMLGIIIGIAAIIATLAIGKGAEEKARKQILAMGHNFIQLYTGNWMLEGKTAAKQKKRILPLKMHDIYALKRLCPTIDKISPFAAAREIVTYESTSELVEIKGGNEEFLDTLGRKIERGNYFNYQQALRGARVAVLGSRTAQELFKTINPIGKTIRIKKIPFIVIGTIKKMEHYMTLRDPNLDVIIPIKTLKRQLQRTSDPNLYEILISAPTIEAIPPLRERIRKIMRFRRKLEVDEPDDFTMWDQSSIMDAAKSGAETIRLLLFIIACISLLVGGIGVMNIMLVSVTERTKEIGIRMALGAASRIILQQFLFEAMVLCLVGGIIGIALGISAPYVVARFTGWNPIVTLSSIIVAFLTTSTIGVFFGFYPARKASRMNPVDALIEH